MAIPQGTDVAFAAELLKAGKRVAIPTETVYGLAANGTDPLAVATIFEAKHRPFFDPLILHFANLTDAMPYVLEMPSILPKLVEQFSPGPVTYVVKRTAFVPDLVSSGLPTVGIRFPKHPLTQTLLSQLPFPLAAPSANRFGYISPTNPHHIQRQFTDEISYILDGGSCVLGVESTILDLSQHTVTILRQGSLSVEELTDVLGYTPNMAAVSSSRPSAPGNVDVHYAPRKPLYVLSFKDLVLPPNGAVLAFGNNANHLNPKRTYQLSTDANDREAAGLFFDALHTLDADDTIDTIYCEPFPEYGLGRALNDRLKRAAKK